MNHSSPHPTSATRYVNTPNRFISVAGTSFAYRELGPRGGVPLVLLNQRGAVLDSFAQGLSMVWHLRIM